VHLVTRYFHVPERVSAAYSENPFLAPTRGPTARR
jgi:hypothetical protein